ncbi:MAG: LysM peptidoglycan-binding domain-containing protein [Ardenticatenales bacterium]|nr:LysM peptidoglycan-binding domain-containing protein [Ardenticatenales bacterium]
MRTIIRTTLLAIALVAFGLLDSRSAAANNGGMHVVQAGETLYSIAASYGVSADAIAAANGIMNPDYIRAGQSLSIPGAAMPGPGGPWEVEAHQWGGRYVVKPGDTLYSIAWRTGTSVSAIMAANGIGNPNVIYAGQALTLPGGMQPGPGGPGPDHGKPQPQCGYRTTVKGGDSLSAIAWRTGTTINALARANGIAYPYLIYPGQQLHVPCADGRPGQPHKPGPRPTARPTATGLVPAACNRNIQIVDPLNLEHVSGTLYVIGTADIPNFQFYKLEYARGTAPLNSEFHSIGETIRQRVRDGMLGVWYLGNMPAGDYVLRLTAVDTAGQFPTPCSVRVKVN